MNKTALMMAGLGLSLLGVAAPIKPKNVTASSFVVFEHSRAKHDPWQAANGKTGSYDSYWTSDFRNKARAPHHIEFDFGKPITFSAVKLDMMERYNFSVVLNRFKLEVFDGNIYKTLVEEASYAGKFFQAMVSSDFSKRYGTPMIDAHPVFTFAPVTGSKVRLTTWDDIARLDEMSVYAQAPQAVKAVKKAPGADVTPLVQKFSFAPEGVPLPAGFKCGRFDLGGKVYRADRGYPDSLRRYQAASQSDNRITVPVSHPGFYRVFMLSGDQFAHTLGVKATVNGKTFRLSSEAAENFPWDIVTVKAEQEIRIDLHGQWGLNALLVAPIEADAQFEVAVNQVILGERFDDFKRDVPETHSAVPVAGLDQGRGFIAYQPCLDQRIFPRTTPRADQVTSLIRDKSATNALRAVSVAFYATRHLDNFQVAYEGELQASVHPIRVWLQRSGPKSNAKIYGWLPENLTDNVPQFIKRGSSLQYYLVFDVPSGTRAGRYQGRLTITADGIAPVVVPVQFQVLPFELENLDSHHYAAMYYSNSHYGFLSEKDMGISRAMLQDMRRHNMNSIFYPFQRYENQAQFEADYLRVNRELDRAGFPRHFMAWHNQYPTVKSVKEVLEVVRKHQLREIVFYPVDEPRFGKQAQAKKYFPMIKSIPGTRTYSTVSQDDIDKFGDSIDFRTWMITDYALFEPDRLRRECKRDGAHFWWYSNSAREYPDVCRFKAGFFAYRCGNTGQTYWCYSHTCNDLWNDFDTNGHDHNSVNIIGDKIYSTIQWEALREGLDDLRYVFLLERRIAANPERREAKAARKLLDDIRNDTEVDLKEYKKAFGRGLAIHDKCFWSPEKFQDYRNRIIEAIIKLDPTK